MNISNIRALCKERNITIQRLEKETKIGNGVIAKWEKRYPRVSNLKKVADYFGVTVDELMKEGDFDAENKI